jgi:hypothetical protein
MALWPANTLLVTVLDCGDRHRLRRHGRVQVQPPLWAGDLFRSAFYIFPFVEGIATTGAKG